MKGKLIQLLESVLLVSHGITSAKAANFFFDKKKRNGAQMKLQTNNTRNRQVVLYEAISCKM